ncbi:MAG TPA: helix-turn-helix transcriptional regulator [Acholeplasmataceae bacterium]|nr:helix-turn-helix transcriptional regulator [Acholeplasmataceae bacterium]
MPVKVALDELLREMGMTSKELCELVGITEANMSILRSGKARAIRFETLAKICYYLNCEPGDLLKYERDEGDSIEKND